MEFGKLRTDAEREFARASFEKVKKETADIINNITAAEKESGAGKEKTRFAVECMFQMAATRHQYFDGIEKLKELGLKIQEITRLRKNWEAQAKFGAVPTDITDAVNLYFKHHEIDVTLKNVVTTNNEFDQLDPIKEKANDFDKVFHDMQRTTKTLDSVYRSFLVDISEYSSVKSSKDVMIAAWQKKLDKMQSEKLFELFLHLSSEAKIPETISIHGRGKGELLKFVDAIIDPDHTDKDVAFNAIASFIWQCKRKLSNQPVTNHLMPVLVGPQGGGKTTAIKWMLNPVQESTTTVNFKQVGDDRYARVFDSLVLFADEMSYMDKANADNLKNLITSEEVSNRPLHSNNIQMIKMNSTFIGASNKNLSQIFFDDSGMRRFIELQCLPKDRADWAAIRSIDYKAMWRAVNEFAGENPIKAVEKQIAEIQEDMRSISPTEDWLRSFIGEDKMDYTKRYDFRTLYEAFDLFREDYHKNYRSNSGSFRNNLTALLQKPEYSKITVKGKKSNAGATIYFVHDQVRKLAACYRDEEYDPASFDPIHYKPNHPQRPYYIKIVEEERNAKLDAKLPTSDVVVDLIPAPVGEVERTTMEQANIVLARIRRNSGAK